MVLINVLQRILLNHYEEKNMNPFC